MSPSWIWSDKRTNERVARVGYNHFISNKGESNNCFSKFSNRVLQPIFISSVLQSGKFLNLAHYFPYDVKLRLLAHSRNFLANEKARNAIVGAENLLMWNILCSFLHILYPAKNRWGHRLFICCFSDLPSDLREAVMLTNAKVIEDSRSKIVMCCITSPGNHIVCCFFLILVYDSSYTEWEDMTKLRRHEILFKSDCGLTD